MLVCESCKETSTRPYQPKEEVRLPTVITFQQTSIDACDNTNRRDRNPTDNVTWTSAISIEVVLIGPLIARSKMRMSSNTTINTRKIKSTRRRNTKRNNRQGTRGTSYV